MTNPILRVDDLAVHYQLSPNQLGSDKRTVRAVDGVSFSIDSGRTFGLVGESGSGKSTLGRAVLQLRPIARGDVVFAGVDLVRLSKGRMRTMRRRMQMVFQDPYGSLDPRMTVESIIREPIDIHRLAGRREARSRVAELLELVGLPKDAAQRYPHAFSGGQRQRIGIARALAAEPDFLVCDEPVSALDVSVRAQIINLLVSLKERYGLTYLFIAHDLSVVRHISDTVGVMHLGRLVEVGPSSLVLEHAAHPYTRALLSAVPLPDPVRERRRQRVILQGDAPSPVNRPTGCMFHTRCWLYRELGQPERCRVDDPDLRLVSNNHLSACHYADDAVRSPVGVAPKGDK